VVLRRKMDRVFKALADPTRRGVLRLLRRGDMSAGEIAGAFPIAKSTLSGHLNVLKEANLVVTERLGTTIVYSLNVAVYEEMVGAVLEILAVGEWGGASRAERGGGRDAFELAG
jgi:DNA-binding transcriptional ArsR family regulator